MFNVRSRPLKNNQRIPWTTKMKQEIDWNEVKIGVVIPCYKVRDHIIDVITHIDDKVSFIYIIDDCCPDKTASYVENYCKDPRIKIIRNSENLGVGGATMTGYHAAISDDIDIIVKIDGDGQMDPKLIFEFVAPILLGEADYTKGNRFFDLEKIRTMPKVRIFGNAILSFMTKLSSGYWNIFDPTNGYTAIHKDVATRLPLDKISKRYFFESDILFRLNILRAVVVDIPMDAKYGVEVSNLKIERVIGEFLFKHAKNFFKRLFYNYYLRDLSLASIELPVGLLMILFGFVFGVQHLINSMNTGIPASAGRVMLAALPLLMGLQLVLSFIGYDVVSIPKRPLHRRFYKTIQNVTNNKNKIISLK